MDFVKLHFSRVTFKDNSELTQLHTHIQSSSSYGVGVDDTFENHANLRLAKII